MSVRAERVLWHVVIAWTLCFAALQAYKAASFDPEPAAVRLGTAMVCDRTGCVES